MFLKYYLCIFSEAVKGSGQILCTIFVFIYIKGGYK